MGAYDKEAKAAKEIAEGWKDTAGEYAKKLQVIKKTNIAEIKYELEQVQTGIDKGDHLNVKGVLDEYEIRVGDQEKALKALSKLLEKFKSDYQVWSWGDPRSNMRFIGTKLKLGDASSEKYKAVAALSKSLLTEVATSIATVDRLLKDDIDFQITTQLTRVESLKKILGGKKSEATAYNEQLSKEAKAFAKYCASEIEELKLKPDTEWLVKLKENKPGVLKEQACLQHVIVVKGKIERLPVKLATAEKNYARVQKSVPIEFLETFMKSKEGIAFAESMTNFELRLAQAKKLYVLMLALFKKAGYE